MWTKPIDWIDGKRYVAADLNKLSGNFRALRTGAIAIPDQAANDFIFAIDGTQFGRLAAVEGCTPVFTGGKWTMMRVTGLVTQETS